MSLKLKKLQPFAIPSSEPIVFGEAKDGAVSEEVQLLRTGNYTHEQYGQMVITTETLKSFVKNFSEKVRKIDLAIDYKHNADDIAAGWIKELYLSEDGQSLWAKVDWTPNGKRVLGEKEFRYLSAEFLMQYQDNESLKKYGPTLTGAGLTNRPFVKGMEPVVNLSEVSQEKDTMPTIEELMKQIQALQAAVDKLSAGKSDAGNDGQDGGDEVSADEAMYAEKEKELSDLKDKIAKSKAAKAAPAAKEAPAAGDDKADKEKVALAEKTTKFDSMLADGSVVEAQRSFFLADDFAGFSKAAAVAKTTRVSDAGGGNDETENETAEQKILKLAEKLVEKEKIQLGEAISRVVNDPKNAELNDQYVKRHIVKLVD
jgi:phage I-like protein